MAPACNRFPVLPLLLGLLAACATGSAPSDLDADPSGPDAPGAFIDASGAADAPPGTPDAPGSGVPDAPTCSPCQLVSQCGCGTGQACDLDGTMLESGATTCRAVTVPGMGTDSCTGVTTCAAGFRCVGNTGSRTCRNWCTSDAQCTAGPGSVCAVQLFVGTMPIPGAKVCSPSCNPMVAGNGCPPAWGCHVYYNQDEMRNFTWCSANGTGTQGAACTTDADCAATYSCVTQDGSNFFCRKNCRVAMGTADCPGSTTCIGFTNPAVIGSTEYGACI